MVIAGLDRRKGGHRYTPPFCLTINPCYTIFLVCSPGHFCALRSPLGLQGAQTSPPARPPLPPPRRFPPLSLVYYNVGWGSLVCAFLMV